MKRTYSQILEGYRDRARALNGLDAGGALAGLDAVFESTLKMSDDDKKKMAKRVGDLMIQARAGSADAIHELNELRMENVDLFVRATSNFATMMFETITLQDNEQFCVEHSYRNPVAVRYVAQDGGTRTVKAVKARKQTFVDMRILEVGPVGYQMRDIQQGGPAVVDASQATVDLAFEATNKVDVECFNLLQGGTINGKDYGDGVYGDFKTTGAKLDRTYIAHPRINTANLPLTNDLELPNNGTGTGQSNLFRFDVIEAIMNYCDSWGNIWGEPIRPTGLIFIPSSQTTGLAKEIKPTGIFYNQVAQGVLQKYTRFQYMDINWTLVPDVTLPKGMCYPVLNRPVGKILVKPKMDQEWVESSPRKNWEERGAQKVAAFVTFEPDRVNALRVQYGADYTPISANE